ncbi:MAG TPA: M23 family metallopeptidase [Cyclobacteriaceae bacterium]
MGRIKYRYNPETCKYEPVFGTRRLFLKRSFWFMLASFGVGLMGFIYHLNNYESIDELILKKKNKSLRTEWSILDHRLKNANQELTALIEKDDNNYRVILDSEPLSPSIREAGIGGSEKINLKGIEEFPGIVSNYVHLEKLKHQLDVEVQSYDELTEMLDNKIKMWASRPAIQPINNKQLQQLHMTYGSRMHPIFHFVRPHKGLDFTAAKGTPVYATGDGVITMAYSSDSYGNVVYLNHGHGFETRYAHLSRFGVQAGEHVKRGQVIAYVGNTGTSVSAHLHYEVLFNGEHVNPINFFQRDLSNKEFDKLIEEGSKNIEPLD